jgi:multidrug efflux pump subunit AcrB
MTDKDIKKVLDQHQEIKKSIEQVKTLIYILIVLVICIVLMLALNYIFR